MENSRISDINGHNPLKRVKFISIHGYHGNHGLFLAWCHNPLKRVKFISIDGRVSASQVSGRVTIPSNGSSLFQCPKELKKSAR